MESMDMDIEQEVLRTTNLNSPAKRFGLKSSIQTNFGDDYIFEIAIPQNELTSMAVSLSTNTVKLYSPETGQYFGECRGHNATINRIAFSGPHLLHSCSSDGTIRAWDTRSFHQISSLSAGPSQEVFSFSFGGPGHNLVAAGCKSQILFWDWRTKRHAACLGESHTEDVTQVHFVPDNQNKLLSASVDGLMCIFDTSGEINDDDHMDSVINVGTSVGRVGFFGTSSQNLWCLTHVETLSVWDWKDARMQCNFEDARTLASGSWTLDPVDYFVDCHYSLHDDRLWVIGGTNTGSLAYFPVNYMVTRTFGPPEAVLHGGHCGIIRSMLSLSDVSYGAIQNAGNFGWSGGEDGRLCCWLSDKSSDINRSWISSALVIKPQKNRRKSRHHPY